MPSYHAKIERGYCNTDRQIPGTRLRSPGKGRYGNRIKVWKLTPDGRCPVLDPPLLDHNSAETYRHNGEVEDWLADELKRGVVS